MILKTFDVQLHPFCMHILTLEHHGFARGKSTLPNYRVSNRVGNSADPRNTYGQKSNCFLLAARTLGNDEAKNLSDQE